MVSGIEAAGLVLAILPFLISGLNYYREGLIPIKDWLRYRSEVKSLIRNLNVEQVRFRITCEKLLSGIVPEEELADLLECPGGPAWHDEHIEEKLKERLRESFTVYLATVADMEDLLQALRIKLGLDYENKPVWIDDEKARKREWKRIRVSFSKKEFADLLRGMGKDNDDLDNLTRGNIELEPARLSRCSEAEPFKLIRDHAKSLYDVLANGMLCDCTVYHQANLRLDARSDTTKVSRTGSKGVRFRIVFSFESNPASADLPWNWRETEIEPSENTESEDSETDAFDKLSFAKQEPSTPSEKRLGNGGGNVRPKHSFTSPQPSRPSETIHGGDDGHLRPTLRRKGVSWAPDTHSPAHFARRAVSNDDLSITKIENLCYMFQQANETDAYLGFLADKQRRHRMYSVSRPVLRCAPQGSITLHDLLCQTERSPEVSGAVDTLDLTSRDKFQLAFTLASTVLQLQSTPWLDRQWGVKDILFIPGTGSSLAEHSYITKSFSNKSQQIVDLPETSKPSNPFIQNEAIFALGVALLELSFGKSLRDLETAADLDEHRNRTIYTDALIAKRLTNKVSLREGDRYGDAFRRCVNGLDVRDANFDNKDYRQAVYQYVVKPLEGIWNDFNKSE